MPRNWQNHRRMSLHLEDRIHITVEMPAALRVLIECGRIQSHKMLFVAPYLSAKLTHNHNTISSNRKKLAQFTTYQTRLENVLYTPVGSALVSDAKPLGHSSWTLRYSFCHTQYFEIYDASLRLNSMWEYDRQWEYWIVLRCTVTVDLDSKNAETAKTRWLTGHVSIITDWLKLNTINFNLTTNQSI